jgi:hypothetical protein
MPTPLNLVAVRFDHFSGIDTPDCSDLPTDTGRIRYDGARTVTDDARAKEEQTLKTSVRISLEIYMTWNAQTLLL